MKKLPFLHAGLQQHHLVRFECVEPAGPPMLHIAVEGCAHGDLDNIFASVRHIQERTGQKIDLLICCGDFQVLCVVVSLRTSGDHV